MAFDTAKATALIRQIAAQQDVAKGLKANAASATAILARMAFAAAAAREEEDAKAALSALPDWSKVKGTWSGAVTLHDALSAGFRMKQSLKAKTPWIIGGKEATAIGDDDIAAIAAATDGDGETTVPALVKRMREVNRERKALAEKRGAVQNTVLETYLASEEGRSKYPGEDVSSLPLVVEPDELVRIQNRGAELIAARERENAKREEENEIKRVIAKVATMPDELFEELQGAIATRRAKVAAELAKTERAGRAAKAAAKGSKAA